MKPSSISRTKFFSIPTYNSHVEFVSFRAGLRFTSSSISITKNSMNRGHLKRIYINQYTADRILAVVQEARAWPNNQHGVVVGFLHYKFYLNNELENNTYLLDYWVKPLPSVEDGYGFPGFLMSEGNHVRGATVIDRN